MKRTVGDLDVEMTDLETTKLGATVKMIVPNIPFCWMDYDLDSKEYEAAMEACRIKASFKDKEKEITHDELKKFFIEKGTTRYQNVLSYQSKKFQDNLFTPVKHNNNENNELNSILSAPTNIPNDISNSNTETLVTDEVSFLGAGLKELKLDL